MILDHFQSVLLDYRKATLGGDYPIIWSFFCDPERYWGAKHTKVIASSQRMRILKNLGEIALWLAQKNDYVILSHKPSQEFLRQIPELKIPESHILVCETDSDICLPEAINSDRKLKSQIKKITQQNKIVGYLPFGSTTYDDQFVSELSLTPMLANAAISARVNTKVYSRELCNKYACFPVVPGMICRSVQQIKSAYEKLSKMDDSALVVVKDPNGVSGKGISIFSSRTDLDNWLNFQIAHKSFLPEYIVETWIPSQFGFNHAFLLFPDGSYKTLSLKKSLLDRGRHRSHIDPLVFDDKKISTLQQCQAEIAQQLHKDNYFGFVGIDGIVSNKGEIYPLIEINARINWSAAQLFIRNSIPSGFTYKATEIPFTLKKSRVEISKDHILKLYKNNTPSAGVYVQLERPLSINIDSADIVEMSLFCILYGESLDRISSMEDHLSTLIGDLQNAN